MLSYAFTTLNQGGYEDVATEEFENIHNLFAAILAKGIGKQLKQGLYREYLNRKDDITVVRGKIDMPGTIRNRLSRKQVLTCEYDELSENNLFNQILKTIPTFSKAVISSSGSVVGDMAVMPDASMMVDTAPWAIRNRAFISSIP